MVLLRPAAGVLVMQQLLYAGEVRPTAELAIGADRVRAGELERALQRIDRIAAEELHP